MRSNALRHAPWTIPALVVAVLLAMIPVAMKSVLYAAPIAGIVVLVILVAWLGLDRTSAVVMAFAFALAPADTLTVSFLGVSDILFFLAIGLAFPRLLGTPLTLPAAFVLASLAFIAIGMLSSLVADEPAVYYYTARVIFTFVILPIMIVWWAPRGKVLVWLLIAYAVGNGISVVYGIPSSGISRNFGLSQHPNALGYTSMLTLSLVPFLWVAVSRRWRRWICGAVVAGAGVGILTSGSRAALVVGVGLILLVPAVERSIPLALTVAIAGVVAIGYLGQRTEPAKGQDALSRLLGAGPVEGSDQARLEGVAKVWQTALDHPWLGTGFNLVEFNGHNVYVQVAAAVGFIGLAALIGILISLVTPLFATSNIHSRLVYPAIAVIAAAPVSPNLTDRYFGLLLGIALVGGNIVRAERQLEAEELELEPLPLRRLNR